MTKLTDADKKFIVEFLGITEEQQKETAGKKFEARNRFSGEAFEVDFVVKRAVEFVYELVGAINSRNERAMKRISDKLTLGNAIQKFDRARMMVLKLDVEAYNGILG